MSDKFTHYTVFGHVEKDDPIVFITSGYRLTKEELRLQFIDFLLQKYPTQVYVVKIEYWSHTFLNKNVIIDYIIESSCPMVIYSDNR